MRGKERPCGVCGTCIDRQKAFEANGIKDPALRGIISNIASFRKIYKNMIFFFTVNR